MAMILAPGATPDPSTLVVPPAAMPATCVPCSQSEAQGAPLPGAVEDDTPPGHTLVVPKKALVVEKHASAMTLLTPPAFRNGWFDSTPVSRIATIVPVPSAPRTHASSPLMS